MNYSLTQLSRKLQYTQGKNLCRSNGSGISIQTGEENKYCQSLVFLVAMLGLDFNWLNQTFEQDGKRP